MSKITKAAQDKPCTARIPQVCNFDRRTSVWAHLRGIRWGAGERIKPFDLIGLIACSDCHDAIDGRRKKDKNGHLLDPEFVQTCAYQGHMESLMVLHKEGII